MRQLQNTRRSRQRGAAMVEMVIVMPFLLTLWMGIEYFRAGYLRRLDALSRAQVTAWSLAMSNDGSCFANKEPWAGFTGENDPGSTGKDGADASSTFKSHTSSSMFLYAHARAYTSVSTKKAPWAQMATGQVHGASYVTCNEVVPKDDQNVLDPVASFVRSLF